MNWVDYIFYVLYAGVISVTIKQVLFSVQRFFVALTLVILMLTHYLLFANTPALTFYLTAALFNFSLIIITAGINPIPKAVLQIQVIAFVMTAFNGLGYLSWYLYLPTVIYKVAFMLFYLSVIFVLWRKNDDDGGFGISSWANCIRFDKHFIIRRFTKNKGSL